MPVQLTSLRAIPLTATFAAMYGDESRVPDEIKRPSSHFQSIPRTGQFSTLVFAQASDGTHGYGECFGLPSPHAAAELVNRVIAPALVGRTMDNPSMMLDSVQRYFLALGHTKGTAREAVSGVDIALWDLIARREDTPLHALLGGEPKPIPTYVSPIPFLPHIDATAAAARRVVQGFDAVKMKIGRDPADDLAHITAAREALGPDIGLMLDANCAYTLEQALWLADKLAPLNINWLEEPLRPDDRAGLRELIARSSVPIAGGENEFTPSDIITLVQECGLRIVQPNISRVGGVSAMLELDRLLTPFGGKIAPHGVGGSITVAASLHTCLALQSFSVFEVNQLPNPLRDDLGTSAHRGARGRMTPPSGPGHGSAVPEASITPYRDAAARVA
ncbi:MAG: mandelate racemase/muconate lactonizing enzyme family protein [Pseudomonadota bacterium]